MKVYVLWHVYEQSDDFGEHDEEKLIGIYSTEEKARDAIQSHKDLEGFKDLPLECFEIQKTWKVLKICRWSVLKYMNMNWIDQAGMTDSQQFVMESKKTMMYEGIY